MFTPTENQPKKKPLNIIQKSFVKGSVSVLGSNGPKDSLLDATNMDIIQDAKPAPRQSTQAYGPDALGTIIGIGTFTKLVAGLPQKWQITMQVIAGVGKIVINKDGGAWTTIGGTYNATAWCMFTQVNARVYVSNGINTMSYYDIDAAAITTYTPLAALAVPTNAPAASLTSGTTSYKYYYAITANNAIGETAAVQSAVMNVNKLRQSWVPASDNVTVTGSAVAGGSSYNWYISTTNLITDFEYLATTTSPVFYDDGSLQTNEFKSAPPADSTTGPILTYLINDNGQLFGVGDPNNPYYLWASGKNTHSGDFSPFNGGSYTRINYGGDSVPICVQAFRTGRGDPVITVLTKGQAGTGKFYHAAETSTTYGTQVIQYFQVSEANGQSGTISPFGVVQANNNIYYPTGDNFKSTGTQANIVNILATNSVSQAIDPDVRGLNLAAMSKCVGLYYRDRIFWALPNGTNTNNEIWVLDLARNNLWILRWTVPADWLWLYEDNNGVTHMHALVGNKIVEFTSSVATQDQGIGFRTRLASPSLTWDDSGIAMAAVQQQKFKLYFPKGNIQINNYGIGEDISGQQTLGGETYQQTVSNTGYGQWTYDMHYFGEDVGPIDFYSQSTGMVTLEPDEKLNSINWEIITTDPNCGYTLASVTTIGTLIPNSYLGD